MKYFIQQILFFAFLFVSKSIGAQEVNKDFLRREINIGGDTYGYRVFLPKKYVPNKKFPVMLFLHGSGSRGTENEKQISPRIREAIYQHPELFNFIIVFPQARPENGWLGNMMIQAVKALDQTVEEFGGDKRRLYLCGYSMGGYGVWATSAVFPHKFAALMPIAGGIIPTFKITPAFKQTLHPIVLDILDAHNPYIVLAAKIGKTPVWMFHGRDDKVIPVTESRNINEALRSGGNETVRYTEWEQVGHEEVFIKAFLEPEHYKWLTKQKLTGGK